MNDNYILIIFNSSLNIVDVAATNEKGYKKSLENKILWFLHPETDRLIPYGDISEGIKISSLKKGENWVEAVLADNKADLDIGIETAVENIMVSGIFEKLENTIRDRYEKQPEGSYTTHLFKSGLNKIRKKTGEEAVELILAETSNEIIYEAADLIYHMMVMFQAENIEFKNVLKELENRM